MYISFCLFFYWLTISKAVLSGLLFGNLTVILYNLVGALISFFTMALMKKSGRFHLPVACVADR